MRSFLCMLDFIILRNKGKQIDSFFTSRINLNIFGFTSYAHTLLHLLVDFIWSFRSFPIFSSVLGGIKRSKNICYPSNTLAFLQQLRQIRKFHNVLKPKFNNQLYRNFYPADFVETCSQQNLEVLELINRN